MEEFGKGNLKKFSSKLLEICRNKFSFILNKLLKRFPDITVKLSSVEIRLLTPERIPEANSGGTVKQLLHSFLQGLPRKFSKELMEKFS